MIKPLISQKHHGCWLYMYHNSYATKVILEVRVLHDLQKPQSD